MTACISSLENMAYCMAPTATSFITGGIIGGVVGCLSSPFVSSVIVGAGIGANILTNKNRTIHPPEKVSKEWIGLTVTVGATTGVAVNTVYRITAYSLGLLANALMN